MSTGMFSCTCNAVVMGDAFRTVNHCEIPEHVVCRACCIKQCAQLSLPAFGGMMRPDGSCRICAAVKHIRELDQRAASIQAAAKLLPRPPQPKPPEWTMDRQLQEVYPSLLQHTISNMHYRQPWTPLHCCVFRSNQKKPFSDMIDSHEYWVCFRRSEKPIPEYVTLIYDQGKIFVQNGQDKKSSSVPTRIDGYDDARKNYVPISEILLRNYSQQILECVAEVFEEKHPIASQQQESASAASAATPAPKPTAPSAPATSPTPIATPTGPSAPREDIWTAVKPTPTGPSAPPVPGPAAARDVPPPAYQEPSVPPYQEPARPQYVTAPLRVANSRIITDWYADYDAERYLQNQVNVAVYCEHPDVEQIKGLGYIYFRDAGGQLVRYTYYKNEFGEEYAFVKMQTSNLEIEQHLTKCYGSIAQLLAEGRAEAAGKGYTPEIFRSPAF